jgi:hypothetical protein
MTINRHALETALNDLIVNQRGLDFQRIAVPLARQRCWNLVASEPSKDGGEDAFFAGVSSNWRTLAVACSITATEEKIRNDLTRIQGRKPHLATLWFYTPQGPTALKTDKWRALVKNEFGVDLVVFSREEIVGLLLDPANHYLAHNNLGIPNPAEIARRTFTMNTDTSGIQFSEFEVRLSDSWTQFVAFVEQRTPGFQVKNVSEDSDRQNSFNCSGKAGRLNYPIVVSGVKNGFPIRQYSDLVHDWLHPLALELAGDQVGAVYDTSLFPVTDNVENGSFLTDDRARCRDCRYWLLFKRPASVSHISKSAYSLAVVIALQSVLVLALSEGVGDDDVLRLVLDGVTHLSETGKEALVPDEIVDELGSILKTTDGARILKSCSRFSVQTIGFFQNSAPADVATFFFLGLFVSLTRTEEQPLGKESCARDFVKAIGKLQSRCSKNLLPLTLQHCVDRARDVGDAQSANALVEEASAWGDSLF